MALEITKPASKALQAKAIKHARIKGQDLKATGTWTSSPYFVLYSASPTERITRIRKGVPAQELVTTSEDMGVPKERLLTLLHFPRTSINRWIAKKESMPAELSERIIGLQKLIGQVQSMLAESGEDENFNAARWVANWLEQPSPALNNARPAEYMDTVEGQELIAGLLAKMQSGAYA